MPLASGAHSRIFAWRADAHAVLLLTVIATVLTPAALAQYRASIQGTVTDSSGAIIPGATLTLTDIGTAKAQTTVSDSQGLYHFNALPPDEFSLVADHAGFAKKVIDHLQLIPEQANAVNFTLSAGGASQTVTVRGDEEPALDTETASINGTVSSNEIQHMPSFGRDVFQLAQLAPGSFGDGAQSAGGGTNNLPATLLGGTGATDGIFKTENQPQILGNGNQNSANGISIDGVNTVSAVWGGASVITPSEDSVGDMKIVSNSYDAENGRFAGAQIQVTTKAGTNDLHGSAFFKADRPGLNAYQRYNGPGSLVPGTAAERGLLKDESRFNQFGGSFGGPIWKNKVFAFFNYETLRNNTNSTSTGWYDTAQFDTDAPAGSIASTYLTFPGAAVSSIGLISETCADIGLTEGVNCGTIAGKGLDIGSPLKTPLHTQDLTYQSSGDPGVGSGLDGIADIADYTTSNPTQVSEAQYNGRLDADVTRNDRLTFTIYWVPVSNTDYNGPVRAYNLFHQNAINDAFAGIWNHTFSTSLLNEARVNAAGWRWNEINSNPQEPFGLPSDGVTTIGNSTILMNFGAQGPSVFDQWTYGYQDIVTKIAGRHSIKMGGTITRLYYLNEAPYADVPSYTFYNVWDFLNDAPEAEGGTFNPATGIPTDNREDEREDLYGFFVQDDFKIKPNLTINLGLRYSYFGPLSSKEENLSIVQLGSGANTFSDLGLHVGGNLYKAQRGNFGPEFGFAWSPTENNGKLVLRGGYGISYNQEMIAISANGNSNPPSVTSPNFTSQSPTSINPDILYQVASNVHSLFDYPANPNAIVSFNSNNLPSSGASVTGFPASAPTQLTYHYSLDTQYEVGKQWVATLGYEGSLGRHILDQLNYNVLGAAFGIPLNPLVNSVDYYSNEGFSDYNALLAGFKHNFSHSFLIDTQYTWAKSMDNGSQSYYEDPYPYNPHLAYGRSDYNVGNAFKIYGLWQPVLFHGNNLLEKAVGGWSLSGIFNMHGGFPWTPTYSNISNGNLYYQGSGYGSLRPAAYKGGIGHSESNHAYETGSNFPLGALNYFTVPTYTPVTGNFPETFGIPQAPGVARNFLTGPGYKDVDATITKAFGLPNMKVLGENAKFEIRADAFNLFNNVNLNGSSINTGISNDGVTSAPNFGQVTSALGSRTLDLQARFSF